MPAAQQSGSRLAAGCDGRQGSAVGNVLKGRLQVRQMTPAGGSRKAYGWPDAEVPALPRSRHLGNLQTSRHDPSTHVDPVQGGAAHPTSPCSRERPSTPCAASGTSRTAMQSRKMRGIIMVDGRSIRGGRQAHKRTQGLHLAPCSTARSAPGPGPRSQLCSPAAANGFSRAPVLLLPHPTLVVVGLSARRACCGTDRCAVHGLQEQGAANARRGGVVIRNHSLLPPPAGHSTTPRCSAHMRSACCPAGCSRNAASCAAMAGGVLSSRPGAVP